VASGRSRPERDPDGLACPSVPRLLNPAKPIEERSSLFDQASQESCATLV